MLRGCFEGGIRGMHGAQRVKRWVKCWVDLGKTRAAPSLHSPPPRPPLPPLPPSAPLRWRSGTSPRGSPPTSAAPPAPNSSPQDGTPEVRGHLVGWWVGAQIDLTLRPVYCTTLPKFVKKPMHLRKDARPPDQNELNIFFPPSNKDLTP